MKLKRAIPVIALLVLGQFLLAAPASAQGGAQATQVQQEIERTEQVIARANELARDAGNVQAGLLVRKAEEYQALARVAFGSARYGVAAAQTQAARTMAERAIGLMLRPEERVERVELELQRTDEMLARARDEMHPDWPETARTMLEVAVRNQERAWELYRASGLRPALKMTLQVRQMLKKVHRHMGDLEPHQFQAEYGRVADLVEIAYEEAGESEDPNRRQLAERAREMLNSAQEAAAERWQHRALQQLQQAETLARKSLQENRGGGADGDYEAGVARYEQRAQELRARLSEKSNPEALRLMHESEEHYRLARKYDGEGEPGKWQAKAEMRIAWRLLNRVGQMLE